MSRGPLVCPDCGGHYRNKWAHYEECLGRGREVRTKSGNTIGIPPSSQVFTGHYQCRRCLDIWPHGGPCVCGGRLEPIMRTVEPTR